MSRIWLLLSLFALALSAQTSGTGSSGNDLFEKKIRPVLAEKCYGCHSSKLKSPMGGLALDTKAGLKKGGASGPVVVAGKPSESRLITALHYSDPQLQMPPTGKLAEPVIADFEQWIAAGAVDPRVDAAAPAPVAAKQDKIEKGRQWWAFLPVREIPAPKVKNAAWPATKIDSFIEAKLEQNKLKPSVPADRRTLIRRATIDLVGLAPSYDEVEAFANDTSKDSYEKLVERLLASTHYGERWGRYWLDVARYAEDNPTSEATNPPYPYAWRYRDWVIEAFNKDVPYDRFVKLQLAADAIPGVKRDDLRALGYLGAAPIYHKDARLSKDVTETLASDDWDERVDAVSRGLLGMTVACARCHDHKFDPILTKDYYALAGVFASTTAVARPLRDDMDPAIEKRFLWVEKRLIDLDYLSKLMTNEPGTKPEESKIKAVKFKAEMDALKAEMDPLLAPYPELQKYIAKFGAPGPAPGSADAPKRREPADPNAPFMNAVYDAGMWVDASDPDLTVINYQPDKARDLPVFLRGSPSTPGEMAPRRFITVLSKPSEGPFQHGSGRMDLADRIFSDAFPLAARVIVNRVWG
ncbi:MAG: PSD1 and planctomycete cytochrome C domain-containing protein, partial [Acidobacteriota bacterium]|nr:PSD1 and planctomycete cytochrome C domain-containing protein [Acidobacteriota bacterium]